MSRFRIFDASTEFILSAVEGLSTGFGFWIGGEGRNTERHKETILD